MARDRKDKRTIDMFSGKTQCVERWTGQWPAGENVKQKCIFKKLGVAQPATFAILGAR